MYADARSMAFDMHTAMAAAFAPCFDKQHAWFERKVLEGAADSVDASIASLWGTTGLWVFLPTQIEALCFQRVLAAAFPHYRFTFDDSKAGHAIATCVFVEVHQSYKAQLLVAFLRGVYANFGKVPNPLNTPRFLADVVTVCGFHDTGVLGIRFKLRAAFAADAAFCAALETGCLECGISCERVLDSADTFVTDVQLPPADSFDV